MGGMWIEGLLTDGKVKSTFDYQEANGGLKIDDDIVNLTNEEFEKIESWVRKMAIKYAEDKDE